MQELTEIQLESITGGDGSTSMLSTVGRAAGKLVTRGVPILNAGIAAVDAYRTWNQSRAQGDSAWTAGTKAAGAAVESATWPLVPLAREAFGVRPAY